MLRGCLGPVVTSGDIPEKQNELVQKPHNSRPATAPFSSCGHGLARGCTAPSSLPGPGLRRVGPFVGIQVYRNIRVNLSFLAVLWKRVFLAGIINTEAEVL